MTIMREKTIEIRWNFRISHFLFQLSLSQKL